MRASEHLMHLMTRNASLVQFRCKWSPPLDNSGWNWPLVFGFEIIFDRDHLYKFGNLLTEAELNTTERDLWRNDAGGYLNALWNHSLQQKLPINHFRLYFTSYFSIWISFSKDRFIIFCLKPNWIKQSEIYGGMMPGVTWMLSETILCNRSSPLVISTCILHHTFQFESHFRKMDF